MCKFPTGVLNIGASGMESLAISLIWFAMACGFGLGCYAAYCLVVDPDSEIENVK